MAGQRAQRPELGGIGAVDLYYLENWSIVGDAMILSRTGRAVFDQSGAY